MDVLWSIIYYYEKHIATIFCRFYNDLIISIALIIESETKD